MAKLSASERADPGTHGDLGIAYKEMGLYDAAIAEFKLLQAGQARAVFALTMIGECVEAKGELGEAVGKYKEALNLSQVTVVGVAGALLPARLGVRAAGRRPRGALLLREPRASATPRSATSGGASPRSKPARRETGADHDRRPSTIAPAAFFQELQDRITPALEAADGGGRFREDAWTGPTGGGGRTPRPRRREDLREGGRRTSPTCTATLRPEMARALPGRGRRRSAPPASR